MLHNNVVRWQKSYHAYKEYIDGIFQGEYYYKKPTCLISNERNNWW